MNAADVSTSSSPTGRSPNHRSVRHRACAGNLRYDGPGLEVIALDSRTERSCEPEADPSIGQPFTSDANSPLLSDEAMDRQIPAGVGTDGVSIVIAAAPVFGSLPRRCTGR